MECVEVCDDDALVTVTQTPRASTACATTGTCGEDLPNTDSEYIRIDDLEEGIGALDNILLDKDAYLALASGDGACLGCAEKTSVHLFTATVEALMQPRVAASLTKLDDLIERLRSTCSSSRLVCTSTSAPMARALKDALPRAAT
jgi:pyruvate-ferredoxin/flavodoxin oxidoreductase